jgi:hypothetical protein
VLAGSPLQWLTRAVNHLAAARCLANKLLTICLMGNTSNPDAALERLQALPEKINRLRDEIRRLKEKQLDVAEMRPEDDDEAPVMPSKGTD